MATLKLSGKMRVIPFEAPETLKQVLMRRDGLSAEEANERIAEARQAVEDVEDPEDILQDEFGLEPDYIFDLLGY